jgi:serine phosphatase RsbU (regulator of sigma subunit)
MKRIFLIIFILSTGILSGIPQINRYGIPFITNIPPSETGAGEQNWSVVQDSRGIIYIANNDNGILEYDGMEWRKIPVPKNVPLRDLYADDEGNIYAAGDKDFGVLVPDNKGDLRYRSLISLLDSSDMDFKTIYHIYPWKGDIYFSAAQILFKYSPGEHSITSYRFADDGFMQGNFGFLCHDRYFHFDAEQGLAEFKDGHFRKIRNGTFFSYVNLHTAVLAILPWSDDEVLIFTYKAGVYSYNLRTGAIRENIFPEATNDFLSRNRFYHGIMLPDSGHALGTLDGGMILTDHQGVIREVLNRSNGIDNETITKVYVNDRMPDVSQLWIALNIGAAHAEIFSPFRLFNEDHGFKGTVNDMFLLGDDLYLATSTGVFLRTYDEQGVAYFRPVGGINAQAWSFLYFSVPGSSRHLLWAGTEEGIYEIRGDKAYPVEKKIRNMPRKNMKFYVFSLFASTHDPGKVLVGTAKGLNVLRYERGRWLYGGHPEGLRDEVRSITEDEQGNVWFSLSYLGIARLTEKGDSIGAVLYGKEKGLPRETGPTVSNILGRIMVCTFTDKGIYTYDREKDLFFADTIFGAEYAAGTRAIQNIYAVNDTLLFFNTLLKDGSFHVEEVIKDGNTFHISRTLFYRLPPQSAYTFAHEGDHLWIAISNRIYSYDLTYRRKKASPYRTLIRRVTYGEDSLLFAGTFFTVDAGGVKHITDNQDEQGRPEIRHAFNNLIFHWVAPYFEGEGGIQYSFRLRNFDKGWSKWTTHTEYPYTNIPMGSYVFEVKARNIYGRESIPGTYSFTILPPWYLTFWAFLLYIIMAFLLIVVIVKLYTRRLQNEKIRLEEIVRERTAEVVRQKEELTDSIMYASRIQRAVLPSERLLNEQFPDHFILFLPRDIVSGDFYWMSHRKNKVFVTAADCTGHGVPGAFMSLLGISFLNEIINRVEDLQPDLILNELRNEIKQSLKQRGEEGEAKDGMDMAMVAIDKEKKTLYFSGAYNPLYYLRHLTAKEKELITKGEDPGFGRGSLYNDEYVLITIPGDKMPIGISAKDETPFTLKEIDYTAGDRIYMFSDGYVDQFGGPDGKKFMTRNFKKLILSLQDVPMKEQESKLHEKLKEWMGELPQIDDIIVIGIQL